jgi:ubiquitin conjugation factor E4 B
LQNQQQRADLDSKLKSAEASAKSMMKMSIGTFRLLALLAQHLTHTFTSDMFAESMASMITYYIKTLAGPRIQDLKVKDPEKYHFRPKDLLRDILVYCRI